MEKIKYIDIGYEAGIAPEMEDKSVFIDTWGMKLDNLLREQKALRGFVEEIELKEGEIYNLDFRSEIENNNSRIGINKDTHIAVGKMALSVYEDLINTGEDGRKLAGIVLESHREYLND